MKKLLLLCVLPMALLGMRERPHAAITGAASSSSDTSYFRMTDISMRSTVINDYCLWALVCRSPLVQKNVQHYKLMCVTGFINSSDLPEALEQAVSENNDVLVSRVLNYVDRLSVKNISSALVMAMMAKQVKVIQVFLRNQTVLGMCSVDELLKIAVDYNIREAVSLLLSNTDNLVSLAACEAALRVARLHRCIKIQNALIDHILTIRARTCCCAVM